MKSTTDRSKIIFDKTSPSDFTIGSIISDGGNIVQNSWNSTNTHLIINVPMWLPLTQCLIRNHLPALKIKIISGFRSKFDEQIVLLHFAHALHNRNLIKFPFLRDLAKPNPDLFIKF